MDKLLQDMSPAEKFSLLTDENKQLIILQIEKLVADQSGHQSPPCSPR